MINLFTKFTKSSISYLLTAIIFTCTLTEIITFVFQKYNYNFGLVYTISIIIHNLLWIYILLTCIKRTTLYAPIFFSYILFAIVNVVFIDGYLEFNIYTFVLGAILYLVLFIFENVKQLKAENFSLFISQESLLLYAPLSLFITISAVMGFQDIKLADTKIVGEITLYTLINTFGNLIYYTLINIYIYKTKGVQNE